LEGDVFYQKSHQGSRKEQSQGVLQSKRKLILTPSSVLLYVGEDMQHEREAEFVEEDNQQHSEDSGYKSLLL
jgi:hypothetical protein